MENEYIVRAKEAAAQKDFMTAIDYYNQCIQDPSIVMMPGDIGFIYHQLGNCCVQLGDLNAAIQSYLQAATDEGYDSLGAVNCNLGKAYAALHDYEHAIESFEYAAEDPKYAAKYKAFMGMGSALMKLGKNAEAGVSFREAALEPSNPDPTKALLNLGVCFMALNRPSDAVQSYESALQFNMDPVTRNTMYANLGQAYVACGHMQKALDAFEQALADKTYFLSESASVDYSVAAKAVATGSPATQALPVTPDNDMSGLDISSTGTPISSDGGFYSAEPDSEYYLEETYGYTSNDGYASGDDRFFNASDEEIMQYSKQIARQDRKRRNIGLKILAVFFALLVIAAGVGVYFYIQGYGYPTQETVAKNLFANPTSPSNYASSIDDDTLEAAENILVEDDDITIDGVEKTVSSSMVYVTAHTADGSEVYYEVSMSRDLLSWKVNGVQMYFPSQQ